MPIREPRRHPDRAECNCRTAAAHAKALATYRERWNAWYASLEPAPAPKIELHRRTLDGVSERKTYVNALRAADYVHKWLGTSFDIGASGTAVDPDGVQTIFATCDTWHRLGRHDICTHDAAAEYAAFAAVAVEAGLVDPDVAAEVQADEADYHAAEPDLLDTAAVPDAALAQTDFAVQLVVPFATGQLGLF